MRALVLFRGSAGCGKSTYIKEHGLKPFTLCADDIRLMCASPTLQVDETLGISQANDRDVWNMLFRMLEIRMKNGEFTVIDATNSKTSEINQYKELAKNYRYRIYCIDMTDIPIEEVKKRNQNREELKRVPDEVIDKFYSRFANQQIPSGIKVLKPEELDTIWYKSTDLSQYKKIHVIGDIHGCYTALMEYFESNGGIKFDEAYIFVGDYIDRGIENADVLKWLIQHSNNQNMIFLEGNHERWLWYWANDITGKSKEFEFITRPQLVSANISKKQTREFYRKLGQCCYFTYYGSTFLVTHGGVSNIPDNLLAIPTEQMIKGVGKYNDADSVDEAFFKNTNASTFQIHGHRNITNSDISTSPNTFNLEGKVEFGGYLRAVQIAPMKVFEDGTGTISIDEIQIQNNIFKKQSEQKELTVENENRDMTVYSLVQSMRANRYIYEKEFGRISSFNFTKQAFEKAEWGEIVNKARGLYIDTVDYKVVARAYDKFFNINERPETKFANLQYKLQFPVTAYIKENGFLGIVGWDTENNDLLITSKSSPTGDFSGYFKKLLYSIYGNQTMKKMKQYIEKNNVSFVFECCDMENDPHIIKYPESKVVLLDIIKNQLQYEKLPYNELSKIGNDMGFIVKKKAFVLETWEDFFEWYQEVNTEEYKYEGNYIEGFVIEDSVGFMTKMKLHYYKFWKKLRGVAQSVAKYGNYKWTGGLLTPIENDFFGWCKHYFSENLDRKEEVKNSYGNICSLREEFLSEYNQYKEE